MKTTPDWRSRTWPLLLSLLLLAGSAIGLRQLALWQYDSLLADRALHDLSLRLRGDTPFRWPFRERAELVGDIHGLGDYRVRDGVLSFTAADDDPYFSLGLTGRQIDHGYNRLQLTLWTDAPARLQLFHRVPDTDDFVFASPFIAAEAGEQSLSLDLAALDWHAVALTAAGEQMPRPAGRWGGSHGVISDFRIDPVDRAGTHVRLQSVSLQRGSAWPALDASRVHVANGLPDKPAADDIVVVDARQHEALDHWLEAHRDAALLLADGTALRTPESAFRFRQWVLARVPQAIWFPHAPDARLLQRIHHLPADAVAPDAHWPWADARHASSLVAVLAAGLSLWCLFMGVRVLPRLSRILLAAAIPVLAACVWMQVRNLATVQGGIALAALAVSAFAFAWRQPGPWLQRLGLVRPPTGALHETAWLTLPALLVLMVLGGVNGSWQSIPVQEITHRFGIYPLWVVLQQLFLCAWFATALAEAFDLRRHRPWLPLAGLVAGTGFALLHFPNFGAMGTVLFMGTGWACLWLRHRSLWPLVISHALLGILFSLLMPVEFRMDGDVGQMYFAWLWR